MIKSLTELSRQIVKHNRNNSILYSIIDNYSGGDWKDYINQATNRINYDVYRYSKIKLPYDCGYYNMYLIEWRYGSKTPVHSHPGSCLYTVLYGTLKESVYTEDQKTFLYQTKMLNGNTKYIDDSIGIHKMTNITKLEDLSDGKAYSLHFYPDFKQLKY